MQLLKEIMDLSVRKNDILLKNPVAEKNTKTKGSKLSFSVDRLLKSHENEESARKESTPEPSPNNPILPALSSCLTPPLPIRPLVTHPPPPGSISLLQSLYAVPTMYTHQVLVRPPELFGANPAAAAYLPMHAGHPHHHLNPMGNGKRKKSWTRAVFSHLQRKGLEKRFQMQKYITKPDRRQLAASLGLTDAQVKVWFQNRRMKWRHMESKERREKEKLAQENPNTKSSPGMTNSTASSSTSTGFLNSNFRPESTTNFSRFPTFLPPVLPPHLAAASTTSATSTFYDENEDSEDEEDEDEDEQMEENPRLVMNADSTGDPEIKVD